MVRRVRHPADRSTWRGGCRSSAWVVAHWRAFYSRHCRARPRVRVLHRRRRERHPRHPLGRGHLEPDRTSTWPHKRAAPGRSSVARVTRAAPWIGCAGPCWRRLGLSLGRPRSADADRQRQKPTASELVGVVGFFRPAGQPKGDQQTDYRSVSDGSGNCAGYARRDQRSE